MRATSIGHAGILVDTVDGSIACDPWFLPQFHGSWFVFPRNDQLSDELMQRICNPTYLYISHIHAEHLDEEFLRERMNKDTTVLIPGYPPVSSSASCVASASTTSSAPSTVRRRPSART